MGNLLIDLGDLHSELKKKVATELRKSDGKSVSMKDVISQLVKLYIDNDELKYHNLSRKMEKVVKENNRQKNT